MSDIVTSTTFQERLFERIRADIGDLMTDEDLKSIVEQAAAKAFFEPRYTQSHYGGRTEQPPLLVELVTKLLSDRVYEVCSEWAKENGDVFRQAIDAAIEKGMAQLVFSYIEAETMRPLNRLRRELINAGTLPEDNQSW